MEVGSALRKMGYEAIPDSSSDGYRVVKIDKDK
jgi:hypothetical protein